MINLTEKLKIAMIKQNVTQIELAKLLNISDQQLSFIKNVDAGHGLIKVGGAIVPFINDFPKDTELYRVLTTKPQEMEYVLASDGSKA